MSRGFNTSTTSASAVSGEGSTPSIPKWSDRPETCRLCFQEISLDRCEMDPCGHIFHTDCISQRSTNLRDGNLALSCPTCCEITENIREEMSGGVRIRNVMKHWPAKCSLCPGWSKDIWKDFCIIANCRHLFHFECIDQLFQFQRKWKYPYDTLRCGICNEDASGELRQYLGSIDEQMTRITITALHRWPPISSPPQSENSSEVRQGRGASIQPSELDEPEQFSEVAYRTMRDRISVLTEDVGRTVQGRGSRADFVDLLHRRGALGAEVARMRRIVEIVESSDM